MKIPRERKVQLCGMINDALANQVIAQLLFHQTVHPEQPVLLEIDSPGGSVTASFAIIDTMAFVGYPIETVCCTQAYGTAAVIFAAGTRGWRSAAEPATFGFTRTNVAPCTSREPKEIAKFVDTMNARLISDLARLCNQQSEQVEEDIAIERTFTAAEAMAYGLVDTLVTERPSRLPHPSSHPLTWWRKLLRRR